MSKINLFKIDESKHKEFIDNLKEKIDFVENKLFEDNQGEKYRFSFYKSEEKIDKEISWNWILSEFNLPSLTHKTQPKAVLVIEHNCDMYALTFGSAFFLVDKFCDRNFAFNIARRMEYKEIKTTTLLSPNMQRNKNISTYINYENLEFDSGESFAKLKAKLNLEKYNNELIGEIVEFGNSIKFDLKVPNLENICKLLSFIKLVLNQEEIYKIPVFNIVTDKEIQERLENNLFSMLEENVSNNISISELDIIGVTEIFNNQDTTIELWHGNKRKEVENLNFDEVKKFAEEKNIELSKEILNIKVKSFYNGKSIRTDKIKDLIDYVDDENRCVLYRGIWYHFNDDYQKYLEDSIEEIDVRYYPLYDFNDDIYQEYINERLIEEKNALEFDGLDDSKIIEKLKKKYYKERVYNLLRERDGFKNYDRVTNSYGGSQIELMDLYKDETMYAVKIGNSSSILCYAVEQSISSLKMYKHNTIKNLPEIKNVAIWLVLERKPLPINKNGQPNLSELNMFMLKNKIDSWKKEVRLQGLNPIIYINYYLG